MTKTPRSALTALVCFASVVALVMLGNTASAKSKRDIYRGLDSALKDTRDKLKNVHRSWQRWSTSNVRYKLRKLTDLLKDAKGLKPTDREERKVVERWPRWASDLQRAARELSTIKRMIGVLDKKGLPRQCRTDERRLLRAADAALDKNDWPAFAKVVREVKKLGKKLDRYLDKRDRDLSQAGRAKDNARRFRASHRNPVTRNDYWREVSSALKDSAGGMYNLYKKYLADAHKACDNLAKGERHPKIAKEVSRLEKLKRRAKKDWDKIKDQFDAYIKESREAKSMDKKLLGELITEICKKDIEQRGDKPYRAAVAIVKKMRARVNKEYKPLKRMRKKLTGSVRRFKKKFPVMTVEAEKLEKKIAADARSLKNVAKGVVKGRNNPRIAAALKYGQDKHKRIQAGMCPRDLAEVPMSGGRADCVIPKTCSVIEIKPDTVGSSAARAQARRYVGALQKKFKNDRRFAHCKNRSGKVILQPKAKLYRGCRP